MNYKTYAEAKIANPDCEIVTTGEKWSGCSSFAGVFQKINDGGKCDIGDDSWVICNPADYCSSVKEFLEAGFKFTEDDIYTSIDGSAISIDGIYDATNNVHSSDGERYILSAAALNGECKIPAKAEQWSAYNNTMPLCDLTDEQASMLFNAWRKGFEIENCLYDEKHEEFVWVNCFSVLSNIEGVYRIKSKSEREQFIENTTKVMRDAGTKCPDNHEYFGVMFDAGARYKDLTQHFGENI